MEHNIKISVSKDPQKDGIVACKQMNPKDKDFRKLCKKMQSVMIIVPGDSVKDITISEVGSEGGEDATC